MIRVSIIRLQSHFGDAVWSGVPRTWEKFHETDNCYWGGGADGRDGDGSAGSGLAELAGAGADGGLAGEEFAGQDRSEPAALGGGFSGAIHAGYRQRQALHHGVSGRGAGFAGGDKL